MDSWVNETIVFVLVLVAVHQHMIGEQPRVLFLHPWGAGAAQSLARGLRSALDRAATRLGAG